MAAFVLCWLTGCLPSRLPFLQSHRACLHTLALIILAFLIIALSHFLSSEPFLFSVPLPCRYSRWTNHIFGLGLVKTNEPGPGGRCARPHSSSWPLLTRPSAVPPVTGVPPAVGACFMSQRAFLMVSLTLQGGFFAAHCHAVGRPPRLRRGRGQHTARRCSRAALQDATHTPGISLWQNAKKKHLSF